MARHDMQANYCMSTERGKSACASDARRSSRLRIYYWQRQPCPAALQPQPQPAAHLQLASTAFMGAAFCLAWQPHWQSLPEHGVQEQRSFASVVI
jgi:hypothetical protein